MKRWIHSNISVDENKNKKLFATETLTYFIGSSVSRQSGDEAEQAQAHDQVEQHLSSSCPSVLYCVVCRVCVHWVCVCACLCL
jgi:hypothetical protein